MEWQRENFIISTDKTKLNIPYIHQFLAIESYWAANIPLHIVETSIEYSLCFGVYDGEKQVGFARLITDQATFGYLADVFIDVGYRGRGLSKWLMQIISDLPFIPLLRNLMLGTKDAHKLYEQFGFRQLTSPERYMRVHRPDAYKLSNHEVKNEFKP